MSSEFEIRPGLFVHRWAGPLVGVRPPNHLRWSVTDVYGKVPDLTRNDLIALIQWLTEEVVNLHKEEE